MSLVGEDLGGPCPRCGNESETVQICCSSHDQPMCASCYTTTHFVEVGRDAEIARRLRPQALTFEEGVARLYALGYHCVETELTDSWSIIWCWRKYHRDERLCAGEDTLAAAVAKIVAKATEEAGRLPVADGGRA